MTPEFVDLTKDLWGRTMLIRYHFMGFFDKFRDWVEKAFGDSPKSPSQLEQQPGSSRPGIFWRLIAAGVLPFAVLSGYLLFSRWPTRWFSLVSDCVGLGVSVAIGVAFIVSLPFPRSDRVFYSLIYILVVCVFLFMYAFWFVGIAFGDWL